MFLKTELLFTQRLHSEPIENSLISFTHRTQAGVISRNNKTQTYRTCQRITTIPRRKSKFKLIEQRNKGCALTQQNKYFTAYCCGIQEGH